MSSTIIIKNSSTASAAPATGDLVQGELAVNVTDKKIFTKNAAGNIVTLVDLDGSAASASAAAELKLMEYEQAEPNSKQHLRC